MPTYSFVDTIASEVIEIRLKISEYDQFKIDNPHLERCILEAPKLNYGGVDGIDIKTDNTWKEVLSKIGEQNPNSPLNERYNKKTDKQVKTEQVLEKHLKIQKEAREKK